MKIKDRIIQNCAEDSFVRRFVEVRAFRTRVLFVTSVIGSAIMAGINAATAALYRSPWFGSVAIYFFALTAIRIALFVTQTLLEKQPCDHKKLERKKLRVYVAYGVIIILMVAALTAMLTQLVTADKPIETGMIIAIACAAYAFTKMTVAVINLVKAARLNDPVLKTMRNIAMVDAAVSMLTLTVTMVTTFGNVSQMRAVIVVAAVAVAIFTIFTGGFMIISGCKQLRTRQ